MTDLPFSVPYPRPMSMKKNINFEGNRNHEDMLFNDIKASGFCCPYRVLMTLYYEQSTPMLHSCLKQSKVACFLQ